jgi:glycerophosphoryl diester phosphodiesterase
MTTLESAAVRAPCPRGLVPPITFAHRGARADHPENTIAAFTHALDAGVDGLETDAWTAGDGEVVLVHDPVVKVRRAGIVTQRLRVAATPSSRLARHEIPRLVDLYRELGADYELSVDLKDPTVGLRVVDAARTLGDPTRLWLCSPSGETLEALRAVAGDVRLVHSTTRRHLPESLERHAADLAASKIDAINLHHSEWTRGRVELFHRFGVLAFAWDAQETRHIRAMLDAGIDALYCDHVDRLVATVAEWAAEA